MIKAKVEGPTGVFIVMGITAENVRRLKQGQPIIFNPSELRIAPGATIAGITLFYGDTDLALSTQMQEWIGPKTEVIVVPRGDERPQ